MLDHEPLTTLASWLELKPGLIVAALTLLYIVMIVSPMQAILWHDELFTFYIAQSPTLSRFVYSAQHVDWQPPLIFATAWLSQQIFGVNEFGTRLPSVLAFFGASLGLLFVLKRHIGLLWSVVPVLLFWFSIYLKYATEARPYGLLIGFFSLSLLSYDRLIDRQFSKNRYLYLAGLLLGNAGMMLSHILAPLSIMPFGAAELIRSWQRRRIDVPVWFTILAPLGIAKLFVSNVQSFEQSYFPVIFQASFKKIPVFYLKSFFFIWPVAIAGMIVALASSRFIGQPRIKRGFSFFYLPHIAFAFALLLPPILINLVFMINHGAFWPRYCITTILLLYVLLCLVFAWLSNFARSSALAVVVAILIVGIIQTAAAHRPLRPMHRIEAIRPDLPMVDASGLAFLEMDHYESSQFLKRLYYLTDRPSAIRYVHATLFEGFGELHRYFPLRATALPYNDFIREHKHFMVFGTPGAAEDWLFQKLQDDGAKIRTVEFIQTPYRDNGIYEVTFAGQSLVPR